MSTYAHLLVDSFENRVVPTCDSTLNKPGFCITKTGCVSTYQTMHEIIQVKYQRLNRLVDMKDERLHQQKLKIAQNLY